MHRFSRVIVPALLALLVTFARGQNFPGNYSYHDDTLSVSLSLMKNATGGYDGKITAQEGSLELSGAVKNGVLSGRIGEELDAMNFEARLNKDQLSFAMVELSDNGSPMTETAQMYIFQRGTPGKPATQKSEKKVDKKPDGQVVINDLVLSQEQIAELIKTYGIKPLPGKYWYDAMSGLYGVAGYPAFGFMRPGHQFGTLKANASLGNSKAFVNGRELPLGEYTILSYIVGSWVQPGKYWLDSQGNAGYEGNPVPVINLYALAKQNSYNGRGGSGDNFWSSRFSAGNSNADNSQGYVSVPGYGPVGYGF